MAVLKCILFVFLLMAITVLPVFAQEDIAINFNSGYIEYAGNFPMNNNYNSGLFISLLNFGMEHRPTNIGCEITPIKYYIWKNSSESWKVSSNRNNVGTNYNFKSDNEEINYSFLNLKLYWNVFTFLEGCFYFGPFVSVNYIIVEEKVNWDKYIVTAGGHIGLRLSVDRLNYNLLTAEMGYSNINGASKYFVGVKIDMLSFIAIILAASAGSVSDKKESEDFKKK